tara:strand:+ start:297 stop:491 length:195 start_codon:yes stop_codon:yes gene_type:complete
MANYHIKKSSVLLAGTDVYYVEGNRWSDDFADRKIFTSETTAQNTISNTDGTNGGFSGASVVSE